MVACPPRPRGHLAGGRRRGRPPTAGLDDARRPAHPARRRDPASAGRNPRRSARIAGSGWHVAVATESAIRPLRPCRLSRRQRAFPPVRPLARRAASQVAGARRGLRAPGVPGPARTTPIGTESLTAFSRRGPRGLPKLALDPADGRRRIPQAPRPAALATPRRSAAGAGRRRPPLPDLDPQFPTQVPRARHGQPLGHTAPTRSASRRASGRNTWRRPSAHAAPPPAPRRSAATRSVVPSPRSTAASTGAAASRRPPFRRVADINRITRSRSRAAPDAATKSSSRPRTTGQQPQHVEELRDQLPDPRRCRRLPFDPAAQQPVDVVVVEEQSQGAARTVRHLVDRGDHEIEAQPFRRHVAEDLRRSAAQLLRQHGRSEATCGSCFGQSATNASRSCEDTAATTSTSLNRSAVPRPTLPDSHAAPHPVVREKHLGEAGNQGVALRPWPWRHPRAPRTDDIRHPIQRRPARPPVTRPHAALRRPACRPGNRTAASSRPGTHQRQVEQEGPQLQQAHIVHKLVHLQRQEHPRRHERGVLTPPLQQPQAEPLDHFDRRVGDQPATIQDSVVGFASTTFCSSSSVFEC